VIAEYGLIVFAGFDVQIQLRKSEPETFPVKSKFDFFQQVLIIPDADINLYPADRQP